MKKEYFNIKLFINHKYQSITVIVEQHHNTVICKYNGTDWLFVFGNIKGISVCKKEDKFDFKIGKKIAIKSFIIKAYGNIKAHNIAKFQALTKKFNHERNLQTQLQNKVRVSLGEIEILEEIEDEKW